MWFQSPLLKWSWSPTWWWYNWPLDWTWISVNRPPIGLIWDNPSELLSKCNLLACPPPFSWILGGVNLCVQCPLHQVHPDMANHLLHVAARSLFQHVHLNLNTKQKKLNPQNKTITPRYFMISNSQDARRLRRSSSLIPQSIIAKHVNLILSGLNCALNSSLPSQICFPTSSSLSPAPVIKFILSSR